ncbi:MAG: AAA+ family ATPase, partial [Planctomycetes bacterium]|nr:AAA+ family ATPase [Planctomycetota bacterium]
KSLLSDEETFSLADAFDESTNRYVGLRVGHQVGQAAISRSTLLVKPEVARAQAENERGAEPRDSGSRVSEGGPGPLSPSPSGDGGSPKPDAPQPLARPTAYFGSKRLDPARVGSAAGQIAEEVLQHLSTLPGSKVEVRIEIHVQVPEGIPDQAKRVVGENARSLKFDTSEFSD